jgi:hypothetical protein
MTVNTAKTGRSARHALRVKVLFLGVAMAAAGVTLGVEVAAQIQPEARRSDRRVNIEWGQSVEFADSLFGGYNVWRSISPDPASFMLLRRFQRRYPVTWTFTPPSDDPCTPFQSGGCRAFVDPDSVVALEKVQVTAQGDSAMVRRYLGISPFNGFPYYYAVTWFSECLTNRNDTLWVEQPQPEIFSYFRGGEERFGFRTDDGDTLEVTEVPCRRISPVTNQPTGDTTFVYQGTVEAEVPMRHYAIQNTSLDEPVYPSTLAGDDLFGVTVIPNPYISSAPWDEPGQRKIQFVNLTREATVRVFTVGGDLVRQLDHPAAGAPANQGSVDWDLKNADGRLVEPGIYIYHVEVPGGVADVVGRLVIVR